MGRSEDGEFELILGNKQLLSVFFIVVVLLGVFFTMGYIVGKNSLPEVANRSPLVIDPSKKGSETTGGTIVDPSKPSPVEASPTPTPVPSRTPRPTPEPTSAPTSSPARPTPTPTPAPTPPPVSAGGSKPASLTGSGEPAPGQSFLQVVATTRSDGEMIVGVLKRRGFNALLAPGPSDKLFRVLVGPLDAASIPQTRTDLENAGFQKPYLRKY